MRLLIQGDTQKKAKVLSDVCVGGAPPRIKHEEMCSVQR